MQGELHRLRAENLKQSKKLIHANKRMLKAEQDIRAELVASHHAEEDAEDADEDAEDADDEEEDMAEDEETKEAVETLAAESDALHHAHHGDHGVGHGSIAPAAHVKPVASARTRTSDLSEALAGKARETHEWSW